MIGSFWKSGLSTNKVAGNRENSVGRYFKKFKKFYWTHQSSSFRRISFLALWRSQMGPVLERFTSGNSRNHTISHTFAFGPKVGFSYVSVRFAIDNRHQITTHDKIISHCFVSLFLGRWGFI